jgi:hypothetical protein
LRSATLRAGTRIASPGIGGSISRTIIVRRWAAVIRRSTIIRRSAAVIVSAITAVVVIIGHGQQPAPAIRVFVPGPDHVLPFTL